MIYKKSGVILIDGIDVGADDEDKGEEKALKWMRESIEKRCHEIMIKRMNPLYGTDKPLSPKFKIDEERK